MIDKIYATYNHPDFYKWATIYTAVSMILSILLAIYIYAEPQISNDLAQYPLLTAITSLMLCIYCAYLWKSNYKGIIINPKVFIIKFIQYELFYYGILFLLLLIVPELSHYTFLIFDLKFLALNLGLTFAGRYLFTTLYEHGLNQERHKPIPGLELIG